MKIRAVSDLHLEFADWKYVPRDEDVVVLAGDICALSEAGRARRNRLLKAIKVPTVYVAGNHEYYGSYGTREEAASKHRADLAEFKHVTFLDPGVVTIGDVAFIGATLWTNFLMCSNPGRLKAGVANAVNDFQWLLASKDDLARTGPRPLKQISADDMLSWHVAESLFIERALRNAKRAVVVTHFMCSPKSVNERYEGQLLNGYFGTDMEGLMGPNVPLWIHGHTHTACDYTVGSTRVVCNPRAYPNEKSGYDANKIIEV